MIVPIKIEIRGPGTTFDPVIELVTRTLAEAGCMITVINDYPTDHSIDTNEAIARIERAPYNIELTVEHEPWGG